MSKRFRKIQKLAKRAKCAEGDIRERLTLVQGRYRITEYFQKYYDATGLKIDDYVKKQIANGIVGEMLKEKLIDFEEFNLEDGSKEYIGKCQILKNNN